MGSPRARTAPPLPVILAVGRERGTKTGKEGPGPCASAILSLYTKGGPRYELDGVVHRAPAPFAILVPEGTIDHDLQDGEVDGQFVLFHGPGLVERGRHGRVAVLAAPDAPPVAAPLLRPLSSAEALRLRGLLDRIEAASPRNQQGLLSRAALLLEALAVYCGRPRAGEDPRVHREAQRLRDLIDTRAFVDEPLSALYREVGITAARAAAVFARAFGITPVAYRQQVRLTRARELLVSTRRSVKEAAGEVGFADPLYFSRAFTRRFGVSPSSLIREFAVSRRAPGAAARAGGARPGRRRPPEA
jgi:AraC-like DNA-binding protein